MQHWIHVYEYFGVNNVRKVVPNGGHEFLSCGRKRSHKFAVYMCNIQDRIVADDQLLLRRKQINHLTEPDCRLYFSFRHSLSFILCLLL